MFVTKLEDTVAVEKTEVKLTVRAKANPPATFKWYKNGKEIFEGKRLRIETVADTSSFIIADMREEDEGEIKVVATNNQGTVSQTCKLTMQGTWAHFIANSFHGKIILKQFQLCQKSKFQKVITRHCFSTKVKPSN